MGITRFIIIAMAAAVIAASDRAADDAAPPGDPVKWVLVIPTKTHEISVPVEFTDLPLP